MSTFAPTGHEPAAKVGGLMLGPGGFFSCRSLRVMPMVTMGGVAMPLFAMPGIAMSIVVMPVMLGFRILD